MIASFNSLETNGKSDIGMGSSEKNEERGRNDARDGEMRRNKNAIECDKVKTKEKIQTISTKGGRTILTVTGEKFKLRA